MSENGASQNGNKGNQILTFSSHIHTSNEHTDGPKPSSHGAETFKLFTEPVGTSWPPRRSTGSDVRVSCQGLSQQYRRYSQMTL